MRPARESVAGKLSDPRIGDRVVRETGNRKIAVTGGALDRIGRRRIGAHHDILAAGEAGVTDRSDAAVESRMAGAGGSRRHRESA
jgi:hypothetical protein